MIKKVVVANQTTSLELVLRAPEQSGVLIDSIDGLSQETADIGTYKTAGGRNKFSRSSRRSRNIVFRLVPLGLDIETMRQTLNSAFVLEEQVTLEITTDNRIVTSVGRVDSFTAGIFKKEQVINISVLCPDPFFYGEEGSVDVDLLAEEFELTYVGEIKTGFYITMTLSDNPGIVTIRNVNTLEEVAFDTSKIVELVGPIETGDILFLSSVVGNKRFRHIRSGVSSTIFSVLDKNVSWLTLRPGLNTFELEATTPANIKFDISHPVVYGGI